MNNQIEIPIWFNGNIKWISNLSSHSTCQDVIKAILSSSLSNNIYDIYQIYECWRGIERPLKNHYRIVKLWKSWKDESKNVILTIRLINNNNTKKTNKISSFILIKEQENKLNSLKHKINKTNKKINEYNYLNNNDLLYYINLSNSIINLNKEIKKKKKIISYLISLIEKENKQDLFEYDFNYILFNINKTLMSSRKLTELSDDIDIKINNIIQDIDYKQILLDKLELDYHLQERNFIEKIDNQYQSKNKFIMKQISLSPTSFINTKTLTGQTRPTAIVEPNLSIFKTNEYLLKNKSIDLSLNNLQKEDDLIKNLNINNKLFLSSIKSNDLFYLIDYNLDETINSSDSNKQQLITLV